MNYIEWTIIVSIVIVVTAILYQGLTTPKMVDLNGASWECESCQNPNLVGQKCDYPAFANVTDSYRCLITCADNSTIQTQCLKSRLVKYMEVSK